MQAVLSPLFELADYQEINREKRKKEGLLQIVGGASSFRTHLAYALGRDCEYNLFVFSEEEKAKRSYEELRIFTDQAYLYPSRDLLFYHADIKGKALTGRRMEVLRALAEKPEGEKQIILTTVDALLDGLPTLEELKRGRVTVASADVLEFATLQEQLSELGYEREEQIEGPGQFAVRGGILDVFPLTEEFPVRIELWGDEVDSIRTFDVESQRSIENLSQVTIYPASENWAPGLENVSFLDYFPREQTLLFLDEPLRLKEFAETIESEYRSGWKNRMEAGLEQEMEELAVFTVENLIHRMNQYAGIGFTMLESKCAPFLVKDSYSVQVKGINHYNNSFELLTQDLKRRKRSGHRVVLFSGSRTRARRLAEDLRDYDLSSYYSEEADREVKPGEIMVCYGFVAEGYEYSMLKFTVISESDIFGKKKRKRKRKTYEGQKIQEFAELHPGDYVVHENHGVGIFRGIEKIEMDKVARDYMRIDYAKGGVLYILATQLDLVQKYAGADAKKPKLNKLGAPQWTKTKNQVKKAVQAVAEDLVNLYAVRQKSEGYEYGPDTVWQREFEEMFPFEETEDQLRAIEDTKRDMESKKIMDRLVCGDVGFGKTEIAIRAAFKAVQEGKQVVYLVPTTILAQQHYNTFVQRLKDFPVRIDLLCRFRSSSQQKKTIEDLRKGMVDIVIGTHRVLSKDVMYKDLGLLIIDEEQRFGVTHKEKIKKLRENIDVLTLTATPIPRTLHMSLIGIRDLSILEEAPMDRMPIQTYVMEYNEEMVREAVERELSRGGQVYYVYNRVSDIDQVALRLQSLVPDATVTYAHGQMKERQLEDIMYDFINGDIDVLVSTTIIETGLDIPNANTMIIQNADQFGLSQLYQLRGRVGRSNRMAYAFLLYQRDKLLKEVAEKRLAAIREFTDLGSGIRIAMRDLEIRGAGNLLGEAQSGHMEAVGYDLYCKMLNQAVIRLKGGEEKESFSTIIDLNTDAFIPETYIQNEYQKLDIYKRIAAIESEEEIEDMMEELIDRFGDPPAKVQQLLSIASIRNLAHMAYVTSVEQKGDVIRFAMYEKADLCPERIPALIQSYRQSLSFKMGEPPCFLYHRRQGGKKQTPEELLALIRKILQDLLSLGHSCG